MFIDSHAHLQWDDYKEDFDQILLNAKSAGIDFILNIGTTLKTSQASVNLGQKHDFIYATVGLHPHDAGDVPHDYIDQLRSLSKNKKVVGIGEVGLDFFYKNSPSEKQKKVFHEQVLLAQELNLPLSIHCRDAFQECFRLLDEVGDLPKKGVFHCFTGTREEADQAIERGFYISISGIVTFKKATQLQEVSQAIPLEWLLIETDCPYLAPEPYRGKRNEPAYVKLVAQKISDLRNLPIEEVGEITSSNAKKLFGIISSLD